MKLIIWCRNNEIIKSTIFGIFHHQLLLKLFWPIFDMNLRQTQSYVKKREFQYFKFYNFVHSKKH